MQQPEQVAIFWDFENLPPRSGVPGYETVENIRSLAHAYGTIISFKAYVEVSSTLRLWSELQASGVSLIDCPHNGAKDVAVKMLIVDMITFAIDHPAPATIFLISGDQGFAYAASILRHRKYKVIILCPTNTHDSLLAQANARLDWHTEVLGEIDTSAPPAPPLPAPPTARRPSSAANRGWMPSDAKGKAKDVEVEDYYDRGPGSDFRTPFTNGRNNALSNDATLWRASSRATSRPYSPAGSFRSAKSTPQTPPSPEQKSVEPTYITNGNDVFQGPSQPELPKGFPFAEKEDVKEYSSPPATTSAPDAATKTPPFTQAPLPKPETVQNSLWTAIPAFIPAAHATSSIPASSALPSVPPTNDTAASNNVVPLVSAYGPNVAPISAQVPAVPTPTPTPAQTSMLRSPLPTPGAPTRALSNPSKALAPAAQNAPEHFLALITALQKRAQNNQRAVLRTDLGTDLAKHKGLYARAKVSHFKSYVHLAEEAKIITTGGWGSDAWVSLRPEWSSSTKFH
ncbi:hypothetical protein H0H87_009587 [Tephrocybe sp. NHM501043]|nr:hypothetical protein H0H87_009587 [Tephrocybe sp. NHM501043]